MKGKKYLKRLLAITIAAGIVFSGMEETSAAAAADSEVQSVTPLVKTYDNGNIKSVGGVKAYSEHWSDSSLKIKEDLSDHPGSLCRLSLYIRL